MLSLIAQNIVGKVAPPGALAKYGAEIGLVTFLNNIIKLLIVVAGLYALLNFILAGYGFMSAGGDPKNIQNAWAKIWQTLVGLLIVAGSLVLAAIFGWLIFGDATAILNPKVYGP